jgi:hypothetical protein
MDGWLECKTDCADSLLFHVSNTAANNNLSSVDDRVKTTANGVKEISPKSFTVSPKHKTVDELFSGL